MTAWDDFLSSLETQAEKTLQAQASAAWAKLSEQDRTDVKAAAVDITRLGYQHLSGKDVSKELAFAAGTVADIASVLADIEGVALKAAVIQVLSDVGQGLAAFARGAAAGALGI